MNLEQLAQELSSLGRKEKEERKEEIYEEMQQVFGDEADAKFDELESLETGKYNYTERFQDALKGIKIKTKGNQAITLNQAIKSKLPKTIRISSSTNNPDVDIPLLEKKLEEVLKGTKATISEGMQPSRNLIISNVEVLLKAIDDLKAYAITGRRRAKGIKIDSFLGGLPLGPVENRDVIYKFWEDVSKKYDDVKKTLKGLLDSLEKSVSKYNISVLGEGLFPNFENSEKILKTLQKFENVDLSYVREFQPISIQVEEPLGQALGYIVTLEVIYNLHKEMLEQEKRETGEIAGDVNSQMQMELRTKSKNNYGDQFSMIDPTLTNSSEDDELQNQIRSLSEDLDPLLVYYFNSPKSNLSKNIIVLTREGKEEIKQYIEEAAENMYPQYSDLEIIISPKIKKDIEAFSNTLISERGKFFLPYTLKELLAGAEVEGENNIGDILEFLNVIGDILFEIPPRIPIKSVRGKMGVEEDLGLPQTATMVAGYKGTPVKSEDIKEFREELTKLVKAIDDYYISPSYSGKLPIAEIDFTKKSGAIKITAGAVNLGVQSLDGTAYKTIINNRFNVKKKDVDDVKDFLQTVISGTGELDEKLTQKGEDASTALTNIFGLKGTPFEEVNDNHMSAIINALYSEMGEDLGERKFRGELISNRADRYENSYDKGEPQPLFVLPAFLMRHKGLIERSGMKNSVGELKDLLRRAESLPVILKSLLKAHDIVRELKGLRPVYGFRPLTLNHSEEVITKMYGEFGVDLSYSEIDKIVTEVDSFSSIAKSLGISEEIVYQVKAQFR